MSLLIINSTGSKTDLPVLSDDEPIYRETDPLFTNELNDNWGYLPTKGAAVTAEYAEKRLAARLKEFQIEKKLLHRAQLFHGAPSGSLIIFTDYFDKAGVLRCIGAVRAMNKVLFTGTLDHGLIGCNRTHLSTTWICSIKEAVKYSKAPGTTGWSPEIGKQTYQKEKEALDKDVSSCAKMSLELDPNNEFCKKLKELCEKLKEVWTEALKTEKFQSFCETSDQLLDHIKAPPHYYDNRRLMALRLEIFAQRQHDWEKLTEIEKQLVSDHFPVLYGIRPDRMKSCRPMPSDVYGEVGLREGAQNNELRVIFVPEEKVEFTKNLLATNGHSHIAVEAFPKLLLSE